jgi:hypothetical protein
MKLALICLIGLAAAATAAQAQPTNTPAGPDQNFESAAARRLGLNPPVVREAKPNEIIVGRFSCDGIFVEAAKHHDVFQLLNPFAPEDYGSAADNTVKDPILGRASGLKFFRLKF